MCEALECAIDVFAVFREPATSRPSMSRRLTRDGIPMRKFRTRRKTLSDEGRVSFDLSMCRMARPLAVDEVHVAHTIHPVLTPSLVLVYIFATPSAREH